jgi:hypothetical protein
MTDQMTEQERKAVLKVLQEARANGIAYSQDKCSCWSDLPVWKRIVNWLFTWADRFPFKDTANYHEVELRYIMNIVDHRYIDSAMIMLSDEPVCKRCGGYRLGPDPSGYYIDARDWRGAPLICLDCEDCYET